MARAKLYNPGDTPIQVSEDPMLFIDGGDTSAVLIDLTGELVAQHVAQDRLIPVGKPQPTEGADK